MQHVTAVFDESLKRIADYPWKSEPTFQPISLFAYAKAGGRYDGRAGGWVYASFLRRSR